MGVIPPSRRSLLSIVPPGVQVTGTAVVRLLGNCARCLDEISATEEVDLRELFRSPGKEKPTARPYPSRAR